MKLLITFITLAMAISINSKAGADIYRLEGGDDIVSFTDSPYDKRYTLIMRDRKTNSQKTGKKANTDPTIKSSMANINQAKTSPVLTGLPLQGVITSTTGLRHDPFDGRLRHHKGVDIAAPTGTPVKPVSPGNVIFSGWRNGYGNTVIIDHNNGMVTVYAHHASNQVTEGSTVDSSTIIALSGSTGRSTGPHLHFEAWRDGENITHTFIPPGTSTNQKEAIIASAPIRRYLQEDGIIMFTNLR